MSYSEGELNTKSIPLCDQPWNPNPTASASVAATAVGLNQTLVVFKDTSTSIQ